jgi:hypothetical protein
MTAGPRGAQCGRDSDTRPSDPEAVLALRGDVEVALELQAVIEARAR